MEGERRKTEENKTTGWPWEPGKLNTTYGRPRPSAIGQRNFRLEYSPDTPAEEANRIPKDSARQSLHKEWNGGEG